jgi:hypothetical protein
MRLIFGNWERCKRVTAYMRSKRACFERERRISPGCNQRLTVYWDSQRSNGGVHPPPPLTKSRGGRVERFVRWLFFRRFRARNSLDLLLDV